MLAPEETYILLPVKRLSASKTRLSPILRAEERSKLTLLMLEDVMEVVIGYGNAFVVTKDEVVGTFAKERGLSVIDSRFGDLNADLVYARSRCTLTETKNILFLLPDLPAVTADDIEGITELGGKAPSAVIAPSKDGGTNALLLRPSDLIDPGFGSLSFERHVKNLRKLGVEPSVYSSLGTELDLDTPEDAKKLLEIGWRSRAKSRALSYLMEIGASRPSRVL